MRKRLKNIGRVIICFDIVDNKGKSLLSKKDFNTTGINICLDKLSDEDKMKVLDNVKLSLSLLQEDDKSHHLFFLNSPEVSTLSESKWNRDIDLPSDFQVSHSQIYNLDDNILTALSDKESFVSRDIFAGVHRLACKIQYFLAFLYQHFLS